MTSIKKQAVSRLFNEYTDFYGRITLNPAKDSNPRIGVYDSENQGLWTGEAGVLLKLNGFEEELIGTYKSNFNKAMKAVQVQSSDFDNINTLGLYSRHPRPFYLNEHHNVSKDEYRGFAYGFAVLGNSGKMNRIIKYAKSNSWFFVDDDPRGGINLKHLGAYRLPTDRGLYKIVAGQEPSVIELLFIGISALLNSRKPKQDTSSKLMSWFAFNAIEIVGYKSKILSFFKKRFDKNMKVCYNSDTYMEEVAKIYFQPDHPFHVLFKGLK